jgi:hypothetical protein
MTLDEYKISVGNELQIIQAAFRNYQETSNAANSTWNLMGAVFRSPGPSEKEKDAEKAYNHLVRRINILEQQYDYPSEKASELRRAVSEEISRGNKNIDKSLNQVYWAAGAIAAAPLAWPILALGGSGAAIGMGTSLAFSATSIVGNASISSAYRNGDLACNLGKQLLAQGPQAMVQALAGGAVGTVLPGATKLTANALSRIVGPRVLNGVSFAAQGALVAPGLYHTGKALFSASDLAIMAEAAEADGENQLASEYKRLAAEAKLSAAQGIVSSVVLPLAARYMARNQFTFDQKKAQEILGRELTLAEQQAIERAHQIGNGQVGRDGSAAGVGNYTSQQLQDKYNTLASQGFAKSDIKKLMDYGIVGKPRRISGTAWEALDPEATRTHRRFGKFYQDPRTHLWWSRDNANHGGAAQDLSPAVWKVFKEMQGKLVWIADADRYGDFIVGKHKGPVGLVISMKDLY